MTIDRNEPIYIYALSVWGWGRGRTIGEALRHMRMYSRNMIEADYTQTNYETRRNRNGNTYRRMVSHKDITDLMMDGTVSIYASNDGEAMCGMLGIQVNDGSMLLFLGNEKWTAGFSGSEV